MIFRIEPLEDSKNSYVPTVSHDLASKIKIALFIVVIKFWILQGKNILQDTT